MGMRIGFMLVAWVILTMLMAVIASFIAWSRADRELTRLKADLAEKAKRW
jgi:hypothetical protein